MSSILDWPDQERPREKLRARGADALSDAELLAVFIGSGRRGRNAVDIGRDLLALHGGFGRCCARRSRCPARPGGVVPVAGRARTRSPPSRRRTARRRRADRPAAARLAQPAIIPTVFACLFLDNRHRVLAYEELFRGSIDGASVHPREVVRHCMRHNAAAVIFAHNHPSGIAEPSAADRAITLRLRDALALVDVRVLDHFVVGSGTPTSLAQRGMI